MTHFTFNAVAERRAGWADGGLRSEAKSGQLDSPQWSREPVSRPAWAEKPPTQKALAAEASECSTEDRGGQ